MPGTPRQSGARAATAATFEAIFQSTKVTKSLGNLQSALALYKKEVEDDLKESFTAASITGSNPIGAGGVEVARKQQVDIIERYGEYIKKGLVAGAIDRMVNYKNDPDSEALLEKLYESWESVPEPPNKGSPYEKTYFTPAEYRKTIWDNFTVFAIASDFTNQIDSAWSNGSLTVYPYTFPTQNRKEAVSWAIHFMYFERAQQAVTWYDSEGDGITDIPDAISNRAEYKELLEKQKRDGSLGLDDALRLKQLKEAAASGDFTNIEESVEDVNKSLRFTEQTILMRNLKSFAENYAALVKARKSKYKKTYLMFGRPSEMVNKLTLKPGMSKFLNFRTDQISQLAPKFKLFQVIYDENNKFKAEVEYKFANKNNITGGDLTQAAILESRGREAVGVKSFEWQYIGTNPVTARNDLTAQLQIYFQSFDDLFQERSYYDNDGYPQKYRYVDLILRNPLNDGEDVERSCSVSADSRPESERQKPEKYETKIIVGWNFRGTELEKKVKADSAKANSGTSIITDLSYFNEVLFMTLIDHEFGIEEDGTFNLTITYRARLDALLQDKRSDILATTNIISKRASWEKQIKELEKKCEQSEQTRESLKKLKDDYEDQKKKYRQESYQSIVDELSGKTGELNSYPRLYHVGIDVEKFILSDYQLGAGDDYLYDKDTSGIQVGTEKIKQDLSKNISDPSNISPTSVSYKEMMANQVGSTTESIQTISTVTGIDTPAEAALASGIALLPPVQIAGSAYLAYNNAKQIYSDYETNSIITDFQTTGDIDEEDINKFLRTTVDIKDGVYNIHYFFFGDLVELLAQKVMNSDRQKEISDADANLATEQLDNIRIILGTMEWFPRAKGAAQDPYRVNLGALPISLMVFNNFMLRRVLAKKRDIYSLLDFIRDFMKYMLDEILGANSEESDSSLKLNVEVKSTVLTMPGMPAGATSSQTIDPVAAKIQEDLGKITLSNEALAGGSVEGLTLNLDKINENNTIVPYTNPESNSANRGYHYLTIYVENKAPSHLRGFEEVDKNAGIYHFHIGNNKSIFKRASFKRTDAKYLRESRFVNESYNPLSTLASVYDVDMEMFGNTIFYPGQYLFINPFGLGKSLGFPWNCNSMSNIMGLGGYHLVTEVSSVMDEDGFSTNVKARWETSGDGKSKNNDSRTDSQTPNCQSPEATEIK